MFKSFKGKILIPSVSIMMLVLLLVVLYTSISVRNLTDYLAEERASMISQATHLRLEELSGLSALAAQLVSQSEFIAGVLQNYATAAQVSDRTAFFNYVEGRRLEIGAGNLLVLDNQGYVFLRTNIPGTYGDNMGAGANVQAGIRGETISVFGVGALAIRMSLSTYTPIIADGQQIGVFIARIIMNDDAFVDSFADVFGAHVSIYTGTERVATTILNAAGSRTLGEEASYQIGHTVLVENQIFRGLKEINDIPHHVYVFPVHNVAGAPIGMFFVGFSHEHTLAATFAQQRNMILIGFAGLALAGFVMLLYTKKLLVPLNMLTQNLYDIANGKANLTKKLPVMGHDEIAQASTYFNQTVGEFRKLIFSIETNADELKKKEESVREKMHAILDASPIVCAVYNENCDIIDVNKAAESMFGIADQNMFIKDYNKFVPKNQPDGSDSLQKGREMLMKVFQEGTARYEWTYQHSDGSLIPTEEIVQRINMDGKHHAIAYSRDLREFYREREKEKALQGKIQVMMEQLNEHVEKQTASVAASSSATEQMIANIRNVTDTLSKNARNVKELQSASVAGQSSLNEVVTDIQGIARESESLMQINSVMENIAGQTNLLSMNAAIEAARAGEAGRGFAVVASEIRKLAESSSQQSQTINDVLNSIKRSIDKITISTDVVQDKFGAIEDGVKTVAVQEDSILHAMEEQGQGSKQILYGISEVNEITHEVKEAARRLVETSKENMHKTGNEETHAFTDVVTGARNRKYFTDSAEQEIHYCVGEGREFNLIMFSIDNLQSIASTHNTSIRDEVLKIMILRTRNSLKQGTLLARYSDENFVISLPNVKNVTAIKLAEQLQKKIKDSPFSVKGLRIDVSVSIGIASTVNNAKSLEDIVGSAEKALSHAKSSGANSIVSNG